MNIPDAQLLMPLEWVEFPQDRVLAPPRGAAGAESSFDAPTVKGGHCTPGAGGCTLRIECSEDIGVAAMLPVGTDADVECFAEVRDADITRTITRSFSIVVRQTILPLLPPDSVELLVEDQRAGLGDAAAAATAEDVQCALYSDAEFSVSGSDTQLGMLVVNGNELSVPCSPDSGRNAYNEPALGLAPTTITLPLANSILDGYFTLANCGSDIHVRSAVALMVDWDMDGQFDTMAPTAGEAREMYAWVEEEHAEGLERYGDFSIALPEGLTKGVYTVRVRVQEATEDGFLLPCSAVDSGSVHDFTFRAGSCWTNPCQNGGTCLETRYNTEGLCACAEGFEGDQCEQAIVVEEQAAAPTEAEVPDTSLSFNLTLQLAVCETVDDGANQRILTQMAKDFDVKVRQVKLLAKSCGSVVLAVEVSGFTSVADAERAFEAAAAARRESDWVEAEFGAYSLSEPVVVEQERRADNSATDAEIALATVFALSAVAVGVLVAAVCVLRSRLEKRQSSRSSTYGMFTTPPVQAAVGGPAPTLDLERALDAPSSSEPPTIPIFRDQQR